MELTIKNKTFTTFNNLSLTLKYDSVTSVFKLWVFFNPDDPVHKELFQPCRYYPVTISHNGELLFTGTLLSPQFKSGSVRKPLELSGYSKTGVLEDCELPVDLNPKKTNSSPYSGLHPLQTNGVSLKAITEKLIKPFGISLVVDAAVAAKVNSIYKQSKAKDSQSVKQYLSELAGQKHVILTHDEKGNLVYTESKATQAPVFDFVNTERPCIDMEFDINGQNMHSAIKVSKQPSRKHGNAGKAVVDNPYVPADVFRPRRVRQSSGNDINTPQAARNKLSQELQNIKLKIYLDRWELNGKIVRPNMIITVTNPEAYLYNKTKFFVEEVELTATQESQTAVLTCVLPEVYNNQTPVNIFS